MLKYLTAKLAKKERRAPRPRRGSAEGGQRKKVQINLVCVLCPSLFVQYTMTGRGLVSINDRMKVETGESLCALCGYLFHDVKLFD